MRFIHAADCHIDSPFMGLKENTNENLWQTIYQSTFKAFEQLVTDAIEQAVDFVLLVGDIYDQQAQSLTVQQFLKKQFERLDAAAIPVYLSYGNHDFYDDQAIHFNFSENVHIFDREISTFELTTKAQEKVTLVGFSYDRRWVEEDKAASYPPKNNTSDYTIGLLHGDLKQSNGQYAPFEVAQLQAKHYDYWALGHIHKRQLLQQQPPIVYPGNLQGRHQNETGQKGYYLVTTQNQKFELDFHETQQICWETLEIILEQSLHIDELLALIQTKLDALKTATLVKIQLQNAQYLAPNLIQQIQNDELLSLLQENNRFKTPLTWVHRIDLTFNQVEIYQNIDQVYWQEAIDATLTADNLLAIGQDLALKNQAIQAALQTADFQESVYEQALVVLNEKGMTLKDVD